MDKAHEFADAEIAKLEKKFQKHYKQAHKEMEKKLKDFEKSFNKADNAMLQKLADNKITFKDYNAWRTKQILLSDSWKAVRDQLAEDITNANVIATAAINDSLPSVFAEGANYSAYQIEVGTGLPISFGLHDQSTVNRLIKDQPNLLPKPKVKISKDKAWNQKKITSAVTQGILQGESMDKVAKRLQTVTDMNKHSAIRNARTAVTGAENAGRLDTYYRALDMGLDVQKQWLSVHDGRTRHIHRQVDGQIVPVNETFGNGCMHPADPLAEPAETYNCRCTMAPAYDGKGIDPTENLDMSKMGGMSYEEWKNSKPVYAKPKKSKTKKNSKQGKGGTVKQKKPAKTTKSKKAETPLTKKQKAINNAMPRSYGYH